MSDFFCTITYPGLGKSIPGDKACGNRLRSLGLKRQRHVMFSIVTYSFGASRSMARTVNVKRFGHPLYRQSCRVNVWFSFAFSS